MKKVLLLGNGFNMASDNGISWRNVIENLAKYVGKSDLITKNLDQKPFTLVFEEIYFRAARVRGITEAELKKSIVNELNKVLPNDLHKIALEVGADSILTTNYDYNFENSAKEPFGSSLTNERKYSIFRRRCIAELCIWHIHGESDYPNTLVLGHDHYSDYIDQMQEYVKRYQDLFSNYDVNNSITNDDWITLFLASDVHIIGLGFDYTEVDLWWLISKKERFNLQGITVGKTYYYPVDPKPSLRKIAKYSILESFGVDIVDETLGNDYRESYINSLEYFHTK